MELFQTEEHYIFQDGDYSLWCNRKTGQIDARKGSELLNAWNPICLGLVYGVIGKIQIHADVEKKLLLIRQQSQVGSLPGGHPIFKIDKVAVLPLHTGDCPDLGVEFCRKHHFGIRKDNFSASPEVQHKTFQKTWNTIKSATSQAAHVKNKKMKEARDREKFEKRICDELLKMFNDTDSFYYSPTGDITNSLQRQYKKTQNKPTDIPLWQRVDDRFFWNKSMLQDLIDSGNPLADHWIIPIIQGFVQMEVCQLELFDDRTFSNSIEMHNFDNIVKEFKLTLISRRSRFRAGTRYKRRGVDETGKVANYVETEQIIEYSHHCLSFVQVRGSVPVFWSQPGYKYRPPPQLTKNEEETQKAFEKHFEEELSIYRHQSIINLVEQMGKEKVICEAYMRHILNYDSPNLIYVSFDFHEYCRGMRFENVSVLIASIQDIIKDMRYCWTDREGLICDQLGVFRVNCIDCLDRTNIVQTALAKTVLETQFIKLGLLPPEGIFPHNCRNAFQMIWANNGDIISRQYAGTAALKGDFTRTGERRLAGMMKDGYNSANRYYLNAFKDGYRQACLDIMQGQPVTHEDLPQLPDMLEMPITAWLPEKPWLYMNGMPIGPEITFVSAVFGLSRYYVNRFKDAYRQATIDLMLGNPITEDMLGLSPDKEPNDDDMSWLTLQAEHVKHLIDDCKKILVPDAEIILGGWALIDADPVSGDPAQQDMDTVLILTKDSYYMAEYDDETDRIVNYQRVMLQDLEKIEIGPEPSIFKSKFICVRLNYRLNNQSGYFHMFRSASTRLFNNMAVPIKNDEEATESLKAIVETLVAAVDMLGVQVPIHHGKLERRKSKTPYSRNSSNPLKNLDLPSLSNIPRNVSEGQLIALKNVGSKAFSNMTSQIAKLNPLSIRANIMARKDRNKENSRTSNTLPGMPQQPTAEFHVESSSDEEGEACGDNVMNDQNHDLVLKSCGILATGSSIHSSPTQIGDLQFIEDHFSSGEMQLKKAEMDSIILEATRKATELDLPNMSISKSSRSTTPDILISHEDASDVLIPTGTCNENENQLLISGGAFPRKLSHSSDEIGQPGSSQADTQSLAGDQDKVENPNAMKTSHSEGALGNQASIIPKELVLPFSKIAYGVKNLGCNIRDTARHVVRSPSSAGPEVTDAYLQMREKRRNCQTRIIEL